MTPDDVDVERASPVADLAAPHPNGGEAGPVAARPRGLRVRAWVEEARPRQWVKNVLVAAAPGAAGVLGHRGAALDTFVAFVAFCLAASGAYFLNDARDVDADRLHPKKRHRPLASGTISVRAARTAGVTLALAGFGVGFATGWQLPVVVGAYLVLTTSYTLWFKHVAVLDLGIVASGFVLRAIAGATATGVPVSRWFFIVVTFGSLFIVAGKRHAEHHELGDGRSGFRLTLAEYSIAYLNYVRAVASGVAMVAYCLWAFEKTGNRAGVPWFELSIVPFVLAVLRYALVVEAGGGGAPEDVVLSDRPLQILGAVWVLLVALSIYAS